MNRLTDALRKPWLTSLMAGCLMMSPAMAGVITGTAPDFTLKSAGGENLRLSEFRGEVVLINFWASWCGPCREEMPLLDQLHNRYQSLGFTVLGVNVEEDPHKALRLLKDLHVSFPVLFDDQSTVSRLYDIVAMPSTVLVDRNGNMRYLHKGYQPGLEDVYAQQVRELVRE
jgi:thiol-disulfide isomerase/thioredoxin